MATTWRTIAAQAYKDNYLTDDAQGSLNHDAAGGGR